MELRKLWPVLAGGILCALSGCSRLQEAALTVDEKLLRAHPLPAEVSVGQQRLQALVAADKPARDELDRQWQERVALRTMTCTQGLSISRWASIDEVRGLPIDKACLREQDQGLQDLLAYRTLGRLLQAPPLRPRVPLGEPALLNAQGQVGLSWAVTAAKAGVAVAGAWGQGKAVAVDLAAGQVLSDLPRQVGGADEVSVSPNGRVIGVSASNQPSVLIAAELGDVFWQSADETRVRAWLPDVGAVLLSKGKGPQLVVVDLTTGKSQPLFEGPKGSSSVATVAVLDGTPSRLAVALDGTVQLYALQRQAQKLELRLVKTMALSNSRGPVLSPLVPLRGGRLLAFASPTGLAWLDLETGDNGVWITQPVRFGVLAKLSERALLVVAPDLGGSGPRHFSFDVEDQTLAPATVPAEAVLQSSTDGRLVLRSYGKVWIGDAVALEAPQSLKSALAPYEDWRLEQQVARAVRGLQADEMQPAPAAVMAPVTAGRPAAAARAAPLLPRLPAGTQVHTIGVYEGERAVSAGQSARAVRVVLRPSPRPMVLVLSSYETVSWQVTNLGAQVEAVLVSGYNPSTVNGLPGVSVQQIGRLYAYEATSPDYRRLRDLVERYTGTAEHGSFQGRYSGASFSVGGR
ncbi:MAG: hypothetical protein E6Q67_11375 [Roseateles sp.]|nr:MAG: hypothetical protein E6Q67_11375 [Roseateles sp.]